MSSVLLLILPPVQLELHHHAYVIRLSSELSASIFDDCLSSEPGHYGSRQVQHPRVHRVRAREQDQRRGPPLVLHLPLLTASSESIVHATSSDAGNRACVGSFQMRREGISKAGPGRKSPFLVFAARIKDGWVSDGLEA